LLLGLAEVLQLAGQLQEAASAAREALELDEQTGNLALARTTRALLDELQANASMPA
jgi:hypothetical protein